MVTINGTPCGNDTGMMMLLAYTPTEMLFYDYGNTEGFYILQKPPEVTKNTTTAVSPTIASAWIGQNGSNVRIIYNPFGNVIHGMTSTNGTPNNSLSSEVGRVYI